MSQPIKFLIVENDLNDTELMVHELYRAGFDPHWLRVETETDFLASLSSDLNLILSDYTLPHFGGLRALTLLNQSGLRIPFVIVSGAIGEEATVAILQQGAADCLLKSQIARLGPSLRRVMMEKKDRPGDVAGPAADFQN